MSQCFLNSFKGEMFLQRIRDDENPNTPRNQMLHGPLTVGPSFDTKRGSHSEGHRHGKDLAEVNSAFTLFEQKSRCPAESEESLTLPVLSSSIIA